MKPGVLRARGMKLRKMIGLISCLVAATAWAQTSEQRADCPQTTSGLYARIRSVGLDPQRVYHIREAAIDRPNLHLDFDDGTLAFTQDICGRITGAFFEGAGEILLQPPNRVERGSLALFTGMAILEEQFDSGYLRFNDDTAAFLQPFLSPASDGAEFIKKWDDTSRALADYDSLRLLLDFSHFLPTPSGNEADRKFPPLLHAHLWGRQLGEFEVFWDGASVEPVWAGQPRVKDGVVYFDIWTSFAPVAKGAPAAALPVNDVSITHFRIRASVLPPTELQATAEVHVRIGRGGERTLLFELSRYLKVDAVEADGRPVDFIQNPTIEGTRLRRKGNDLVAVVFPASLAAGQQLEMSFTYAGEVLSAAGNGLLYVGERGTWYPNFGLSPAQFDMEFHYPADWTLVATGKTEARDGAEANPSGPAEKVFRWSSERPIPVAGFNLGKYVHAQAKAGDIVVEAYGTKGVEQSFPKPQPELVQPVFPGATQPRAMPRNSPEIVRTPAPPSPAHDTQAVADKAARAIVSFSQWFGPYPYDSLALTQMPGTLSQGWPSLVFLSSFAFLSPQEQSDLHLDPVTRALDSQVLVHETAHQWWGDLVLWKSYHDQWLMEGLANYSSFLLLEQENPAEFRQVMESYRRDLLSKNKDGEWLRDAGPVTLGMRLESSHFPDGYEAISYERGTWLFHMLRSMLRDSALQASMSHNPALRESESASRSRKGRTEPGADPDEPFFRALRKARERYAGKSMSTEELVQVFEEELPRPLWYEKRPKLDWFQQGWIEGTAIPELETRGIRITQKGAVTTVTGEIVQKDAPEDLVTAVPVYAATEDNALVFLGEVLADGDETPFRLSAPRNTRKIVLDPMETILRSTK
ncbi:MAG: M1 family aminopeptidase [Terriglobales bacterium]